MYGLPDLSSVKLQGMAPNITLGESYPVTVDQTGGATPSVGAPAQATHRLRGRPIVVRDGKWVFEDTGEEAK